jgi:phenylpropionate dioxygenase-like ring-hydroxylating dioxygenase large terminal subunit
MNEFRQASVGSGACTLPGRSYASEEVFQAEQERLFCHGWMCAGRSEQVPEAGDYLAASVGGESLLIVRDSGALRAFFNVCRHRGARLCEAERGRVPDCIRCPYHGWTYALDGRLIAARHMQEVEGFDRQDYPLVPAALAEWEGFLFVNLAREPEPFARAFAPLLDRFTRWGLPSLRAACRIGYEVRANWKVIVQNYSECYHCPLIHPELVRLSPASSGRNDLTEGPFLGGYMLLNDRCASMTATGRTARPPIGQVAGEELNRVYYYAIFPNLLLSLHPDYAMAHFLLPESAARTRIACEWYFDPATIAQPGFDPEDAVEFWDRTNRQDWHVCELSQLGVASRAYTPGPYANQEGLSWAFDQEYLRRMNGAPEG